jgi:two-component system sensor histidine kinase MprB
MTRPLAAVRNSASTVDQRWRGLPLRTRLTTAAALSATLAILAVIAVAYVAVRHELRAQIDDQLRRQATEVEVQRDVGPVGPQTDVHSQVGDIGGFVQLINDRGDVQRAQGETVTLPVSFGDRRVAATGAGTVMHDGRAGRLHVRVLTQPLGAEYPNLAVQIALPLTDVDHQLHVLSAAFVLLALGGLGLTVLLSWGAVRRVTRPVRTLTEAAEQIAATRDLTLRIAAENDDELGRLATAFNTMLDALERSLNAQRQLVTDASHELRTPLASLRTNVEVLNDLDRLTPEQRRDVLDGIVTQLEELTGLVADVVELARGEAPRSDHEEVAFDELVLRAVERAQRHWPNVTFRTTTTPVVVRGVAGRLDRAVANMLDNAGKFSPADAEVVVLLTAGGTLSVADRGPGVPDEALPHVFDRFYRADEARALPGSGLGLAIAQQVVEGHGGSIELTNRDGGGAVAVLALPTGEESVPEAADADAAEGARATGEEPTVPMPVEESLFR